MIIRIFSLLFVALLALSGCQKEKNIGYATLINLHGQVKVNGKDAHPGMGVKLNDSIETGKASSAEILFDSRRDIIRIKAGTSIELNQEGEFDKIHIKQGWLAGIIKTRKLKFETPTVTAGVRGTAICLNVENQESTYTCTCNGTIHYKGQHDEGKEITAAHHSGQRYVVRDGKPVMIPAGMEFHSDRDLEEMAARMDNYKIDWKVPD